MNKILFICSVKFYLKYNFLKLLLYFLKNGLPLKFRAFKPIEYTTILKIKCTKKTSYITRYQKIWNYFVDTEINNRSFS